MSETLLKSRTGRQATARNAEGFLRLGPGCEVIGLPWHVASAMEGRVFAANFGKDTTPIDWAKTAYDEDQPQAVLRVPSSIVVVPLFVGVTLEDSAGTNTEMILGMSQNDIGNGTSTAATIGPVQLHGANNRTSNAVPRQEYTANSTALTNKIELLRRVYAFVDATTDPFKEFLWSYLTHPVPILKGPASLILWIDGTGTSAQGFAQMVWAEFDSTDLDGA